MTTITIDRELLEQALVALSAPNHCVFSEPPICVDIRAALAAPATAPTWYDAQQAEIESLRWTVKDALESLDNGMTADCRATLSSATKETP